tara:strand:+ start:420 stop:614 length:195 start_codon:yes stop_codon:yes gene_type:complete
LGDNPADKLATRHEKRRRRKNNPRTNLGGGGNPMNSRNARRPPLRKNNINITNSVFPKIYTRIK